MITGPLKAALAVLLAGAMAARPVSVCAGMAQGASPAAAAAHGHLHDPHAGHAPAAPHHHHDEECCGVCATACGCGPATTGAVALALPTVTLVRAAAPRAEPGPRGERRYLQPFAIGPPASIVA